MKRKQITELHTKTQKELKKLVEDAQKELVLTRTDWGAGKLKDAHLVKKKQRDLARLKTILGEKKLLEPDQKETKTAPKAEK